MSARVLAVLWVAMALALSSAAQAAAPPEGQRGGAEEAVPKVLHIVPWKQLEPRRPRSRPPARRVEHVPEPLDRDAFRRELRLRRQQLGTNE